MHKIWKKFSEQSISNLKKFSKSLFTITTLSTVPYGTVNLKFKLAIGLLWRPPSGAFFSSFMREPPCRFYIESTTPGVRLTDRDEVDEGSRLIWWWFDQLSWLCLTGNLWFSLKLGWFELLLWFDISGGLTSCLSLDWFFEWLLSL